MNRFNEPDLSTMTPYVMGMRAVMLAGFLRDLTKNGDVEGAADAKAELQRLDRFLRDHPDFGPAVAVVR